MITHRSSVMRPNNYHIKRSRWAWAGLNQISNIASHISSPATSRAPTSVLGTFRKIHQKPRLFSPFIFQTEHSDPGVLHFIFMHVYIFDTCLIGHYIIRKKNYMLSHISYIKMKFIFHYYLRLYIILF